jgi:hypothetical protein
MVAGLIDYSSLLRASSSRAGYGLKSKTTHEPPFARLFDMSRDGITI